MKEISKNYINQYKFLFYLSWIVLYFIFPVWRLTQIYISFTREIINVPYWTHTFGFITYFLIAAYLLNYFFKNLFVDEPLIIHSNDWSKYVKNNLWLVVVCCIAGVLHIFSHSLRIGASAYSLRIYNIITDYWHKLFDFPIQYPIWLFLLFLLFIAKQKKLVNSISNHLSSWHDLYRSNYLIKLLSIIFIVGIFIVYKRFYPYYTWQDHVFITYYPPVGTLLHLSIYSLFGTGNVFIAPITVQFTFYILSGVFLYRTIKLFCEKETALLGSSIYLFSPLIFSYATIGFTASGTIFFIIIVSYFFLKFIRDAKNKDLLLTAYFISLGSLYYVPLILLFLICCAYLIVNKIKQKNFQLATSLKVLSLSLISFLPWYFIGNRLGPKIILAHLSTLDNLFSALLMILSQLSWPIFLLFLFSIVFALYKRDPLSIFFGFIFITYYILFTTIEQQTVHRYSMTFYPTISVFIALFIHSVLQKIRWKHAFKVVFSVLIIYLAVLCIIPRSSTTLITFKYTDLENQRFPGKEALEWILTETGNSEKVLALYFPTELKWYARKKEIAPEKIIPVKIHYPRNLSPSDADEVFRQNLKEQCEKHKISYIMFNAYDDKMSHPFYNDMFSENGFIRKILVNSKLKERKIKKFLKENAYNDYEKFNLDGNLIYIYKLNSDFIEKQ